MNGEAVMCADISLVKPVERDHGEAVIRMPDGSLKSLSSYMDRGAVLDSVAELTAQVRRHGHYIALQLRTPLTEEQLQRAPEIAAAMLAENAQWREETNARRRWLIEHLPVPDGTADVIISNCVINLSPEKESVFKDTFRVLKPGGRLAVADIVAIAPLPDDIKEDMGLYVGCVAGAAHVHRHIGQPLGCTSGRP